jgi:hypothetical protein
LTRTVTISSDVCIPASYVTRTTTTILPSGSTVPSGTGSVSSYDPATSNPCGPYTKSTTTDTQTIDCSDSAFTTTDAHDSTASVIIGQPVTSCPTTTETLTSTLPYSSKPYTSYRFINNRVCQSSMCQLSSFLCSRLCANARNRNMSSMAFLLIRSPSLLQVPCRARRTAIKATPALKALERPSLKMWSKPRHAR